jgi:hypothetical protein
MLLLLLCCCVLSHLLAPSGPQHCHVSTFEMLAAQSQAGHGLFQQSKVLITCASGEHPEQVGQAVAAEQCDCLNEWATASSGIIN